jgi:hypothetical protein
MKRKIPNLPTEKFGCQITAVHLLTSKMALSDTVLCVKTVFATQWSIHIVGVLEKLVTQQF